MKDRVVENVSCLGDESEIEIKYIFKDYKKLSDSQYLEFDSSMIRKEKGFLDQLVENENKHIKNSENLNNSSELPKAKYHKIMNKISSPIVIDINDKNKLENAQIKNSIENKKENKKEYKKEDHKDAYTTPKSYKRDLIVSNDSSSDDENPQPPSNDSEKQREKNENIEKSLKIFKKAATCLDSHAKSSPSIDMEFDNYIDPNEVIEPEMVDFIQVEKKIGENYCEAFFISGLPFSEAKVIPDSTSYIAPCLHEECSLMHAFKPEIIYRYPAKDYKGFEINNTDASLCFPSGLKLCFESNEKKVKAKNNFITIITNSNGERMYMANYHFFKKFDVMDFQTDYKNANPLRYFFSKVMPTIEEDAESKWTKNKQYIKQKEACIKFSERDYIFVPFCLTLVSSYPNNKALMSTLESITKTLVFSNNKDKTLLEKFLTHIIYEVPVAPYNTLMKLSIPFHPSKLEIQGGFFNDLPTVDCEFGIIFNLSIDNILLIHYLTILEQKILFLSPNSDYSSLTNISEAFIALLYPMKWVNTYIPVLTEDFVKYLQSFMPFVMGIDESILKIASEYLDSESLFIVDLKKDSIFYGKDKKKVDMKTLWKTMPKLPDENIKFLSLELKEVKKVHEKAKKDKKNPNALIEAELLIRRTFAKSMMIMYGDYKYFTSFIDGVPFFNTNIFISNRKGVSKDFYNEFAQTQIFRHFLQVSATSKELVHYSYFQKICNDHRFYFSSNQEGHTEQAVTLMRSKTSPIKSVPLTARIVEAKSFKLENFKTEYSSQVVTTEKNEGTENVIKYTISSFFNGSLDINPELKNHTSNTNLNLCDLEKRVFGNVFSMDLFNKIQCPEQVREYTKIKNLYKHIVQSHNDLHHYNFIKMYEGDDQKKSEKRNAYWKLSHQLSGIKEQRKLMLSLSEKDETVNKFVQQQFKRKQSLITMILSSDDHQLTIYEEQIGDIIKDEMGKLLTSNVLGKENVRDLSYIFKYKYARSKFAIILFQDKFREEIKHCLDETSFQELYEIITNALVSSQSDANYEDVRMVTKSTFYYYKIIEHKNKQTSEHFIYQDFAKKTPFNFWKQTDFWKFYLDAEIDENSNIDGKITDLEDYYFNQLMGVARVMISLNLDFKLIIEILCDRIARSYLKNENLISEVKIILEKLKNGSTVGF